MLVARAGGRLRVRSGSLHYRPSPAFLQGDTPINERQRILFNSTPSGGTFTLTFEAQTTSAIAWDIDGASLLAALESLSSIGSGNIQIDAWDGTNLEVQFIGALANTNVSQMTCDSSAMTTAAGAPTVDEITAGVTGVQEVQRVTITNWASVVAGDLVINGITVTGGIGFTSGESEGAIENAGGANTPCTTTSISGTPDGTFDVTYDAEAPISDTLLDFTGTTLYRLVDVGLTISTDQEGSGSQNEIQRITTAADEGTFTLTINWPVEGSQTTGTLNYNDDAATVQAAINATATLSSVTCSGTLAAGMTVTFDGGASALVDIDQMGYTAISTLNDHELLGVSAATTTQGVTPVKEKQRVTLPAGTSGGTFKVNDGSGDSSVINWNDNDAAVDSAVDATFACTVTGSGPPWDIEWDDVGPRDALTISENTLTKGLTDTESTIEEGSSAGGGLLMAMHYNGLFVGSNAA